MGAGWSRAARGRAALARRLGRAYLWLALAHVCFKLLALVRRHRRVARHIRHLPGRDIDWTGRQVVANQHRIHDFRCEEMLENPGQPLVRTIAPDIEVVCCTPEAVETMLKTEFAKVTKPSRDDHYLFGLLAEWLGDDGIFVLRHGDLLQEQNTRWSNQRKTASKIFTKSNFVNLMYDTLVEKSDKMLDALDLTAKANQGVTHADRNRGATPVNLQEMFFCFTFDSIQKILFNREVNSVGGEEDEYAKNFDLAHRAMLRHVITSIPALLSTMLLLPFPFGSLGQKPSSLNPGFWLFRRFFNKPHRDFRENVAKIHSATRKLVREAREATPKDLEQRRDLLANFLKSKQNFSDKELQDVILNFILAGRDTTACTLTWMFYELTQNPEVQEKAAEEVLRKLPPGAKPTIEDIDQENMPYLHGVLLETLRLHPPVPQDVKSTLEDVTFPDGTVIPAGVKLVFSPYAMGRDPTRYEDPLKFRPERWLTTPDPTSSPMNKSMFEMPVFQAGPRYCLGMQLAKNETKLLASRMLQRYTFALEANERPEDITYALMVTMSLQNKPGSHDLWIVPRFREGSTPVAAA